MKFQKSGIIILGAFIGVITSVYAADALYVDPSGNVGVGTSSPTKKFQVEAIDSANIYIRNTSTVSASRTMFILENKGKTRFQIANGSGSWTFDNAGTKFQISRVGTGIPEFEIHENGDGHFTGDVYADEFLLASSRELKTDFEPVDGQKVLQKLDSLEILSWRYTKDEKADRHIGPVAEDFQEVFDLGDKAHLSAVDTSGIAFVAIKALIEENNLLKERLDSLEKQQAAFQAAMVRLIEERQVQNVLTSTAVN